MVRNDRNNFENFIDGIKKIKGEPVMTMLMPLKFIKNKPYILLDLIVFID